MEVVVKYPTDEALLAALKLGDEDAFEQLIWENTARLLRIAFNRLDNKADAEDLVQDLFLEIWEKRQKLEIHISLKNYLNIALKNRIFNHISRGILHQRAMDNLWLQMEKMQVSVLDILAEKDLKKTLSEVIADLPEKMQQIFILRGEDYSLKEIAIALGLAEQTVKGYSAEMTKRVKTAILDKYPDIHHSFLVAVALLLTKN